MKYSAAGILVLLCAMLPPARLVGHAYGQSVRAEESEGGGFRERQVIMTVDLPSLTYNREYLDTFQSSVFYTPKTAEGYDLYMNEFPRHHVTRLAKFEVALSGSTSRASFNNYLQGQRPLIQAIADHNDRLVVYIAKMPAWLSVSVDTSTTAQDADWMELNRHRPRNYQLWKDVIRDGVNYFDQFGIPVYYEVWNEPGNYWAESDGNYLQLYEETAAAIKEANPAARVGGAALASSEAYEPDNLNRQLIWYAKSRGLPLDFLSWHNYLPFPSQLIEVKESLMGELAAAGYAYTPEFIVSEWNSNRDLRASEFASAFLAEKILTLARNEIDLDLFTFFEDPDVYEDLSGRGLLMRDGTKKPIYYAYRFLDQLTTPGTGIAVLELGTVRLLVSRTGDQCYQVVLWDFDAGPVIDAGFSTYVLTFPGFDAVEVLSAEAVRQEAVVKETMTYNNQVSIRLQRDEVASISFCLM